MSVILYSAMGERARYRPRYLIIPFVLLISPLPTFMNDRNETVMYNIGISKVISGMFRNFVFSFSFPADIVKDELEYLVNSGRKFNIFKVTVGDIIFLAKF